MMEIRQLLNKEKDEALLFAKKFTLKVEMKVIVNKE